MGVGVVNAIIVNNVKNIATIMCVFIEDEIIIAIIKLKINMIKIPRKKFSFIKLMIL